MKATVCAALIHCSAAVLACCSARAASFTVLGPTSAQGVSSDGAVVVGYGPVNGHSEAFRWTAENGQVFLGGLLASNPSSDAWGISNDGSVIVGGSTGSSGYEAFRWTKAEGFAGLGDLPGGETRSLAVASSGDGSRVAGWGFSEDGAEAFHWTAETGMVGLGDLPGGRVQSVAAAISLDGSVVAGTSLSSNGEEAFVWTAAAGMIGLGDLPGSVFLSSGHGISADGSTVVGHSSSSAGLQAFRWTQATGMLGLGDLAGGSFASVARAVSGDGSVIVGAADGGRNAFIWTADAGIRSLQKVLQTDYSLDLQGVVLMDATAVSPDGSSIVGYGIMPDSRPVAWLARVPEPRTGSLAAPALIVLHWARRRRWSSRASASSTQPLHAAALLPRRSCQWQRRSRPDRALDSLAPRARPTPCHCSVDPRKREDMHRT